MNLGKLMKGLKGAATPEELMELFAGLGVNAEIREMSSDDARAIAAAAKTPGAERKFISLNGGQVLAMFVLPPPTSGPPLLQ